MKLIGGFFTLLFLTSATIGQSISEKHWVFFTDKNGVEQPVTKSDQLKWWDVPVSSDYVSQLESLGFTVHVQSKWLNGVSISGPSTEVNKLKELTFVKSIKPVTRYKPPTPRIDKNSRPLKKTNNYKLDYGNAEGQVSLTGLADLHDLGITGKGIIAGVIDAGIHWQQHEAFTSLSVLDEYDFVDDDADPSGDNEDLHGTAVLSLMAAYKPGETIGGAFDATYLLAKTEDINSETQIEEDNWVAGIEWMESLGIDVVNSSLGYTTFDDELGYFYENGDFDGQTAVTTIAADIAAQKGVAVFNAIGNEGNSVVGTLISPSDGFHVFASGAVSSTGIITSFSSTGPTNDGRIKPDGLSWGASNYVAYPPDKLSPNGAYAFGSGTSYASPLSASAGALILSVYPELTPDSLYQKLRMTASRFSTPDHIYGYGLLDAKAALFAVGPAVSNFLSLNYKDNGFTMDGFMAWENEFNDDETEVVLYAGDTEVARSISTVFEEGHAVRFEFSYPAQTGDTLFFAIEGETQNGMAFTWPLKPEYRRYFVYGDNQTETSFLRRGRQTASVDPSPKPESFSLSAAYPNPFNPVTNFNITVPKSTDYKLIVYNVLGQQVFTQTGQLAAGTQILSWKANGLASGMYILSVIANNQRQSLKVVYQK